MSYFAYQYKQRNYTPYSTTRLMPPAEPCVVKGPAPHVTKCAEPCAVKHPAPCTTKCRDPCAGKPSVPCATKCFEPHAQRHPAQYIPKFSEPVAVKCSTPCVTRYHEPYGLIHPQPFPERWNPCAPPYVHGGYPQACGPTYVPSFPKYPYPYAPHWPDTWGYGNCGPC
ncbi:cornifin-B-like [Dermochelys coriacea]|uniref:cornifin-B-like n=1 Tax=Dermochelys coriacea TaxID=27794 RepID=UPI0018E797D0|nr:cornifin-B-like [Dermochelys coriacea]